MGASLSAPRHASLQMQYKYKHKLRAYKAQSDIMHVPVVPFKFDHPCMTGQLLGCMENAVFSILLVALMYVFSWDLHGQQYNHKQNTRKNGNIIIVLMTVSTVCMQVLKIRALILAWYVDASLVSALCRDISGIINDLSFNRFLCCSWEVIYMPSS